MEKGEKGKGISYIARKNIDNTIYLFIMILIIIYFKLLCENLVKLEKIDVN